MERRVLSNRSAGTSYPAVNRLHPFAPPQFLSRRCYTNESVSVHKASSTDMKPRAEKNEECSPASPTTPGTQGPHEKTSNGIDVSWTSSTLESDLSDGDESDAEQKNNPLYATLPLLGIGLLIGGGFLFKDTIRDFLQFFVMAVEEWGPAGYAAYAAMYIALEVLCVPAIPLTMTAGVIFGPYVGTAMVSGCSTAAAAISFLIARYAARDRVLEMASKNQRWASIDKAIGKDGLKFVTLLRLSPLLPLAASNYLYGLTSVDLGSYVLGSWIGMLPGTYAYVTAGDIGKAVIMQGEGSLDVSPMQVGIGLGVTVLVLGYVGQLAKKAVEEVEQEDQ